MRRLAPIVSLSFTLACAVHQAYGFRAAEITIGDRGISIPVPPPSLTDEPIQDSTVEGVADFELGDDSSAGGLVSLRLRDTVSGAEAATPLTSGAMDFQLDGVRIDHSDNCLELWLEAPDGAKSDVVRYHTVIQADDQTVQVEPGCP